MKQFELTAGILIVCSVLLYLAGWAALVLRKPRTGWLLTASAWGVSVMLVAVNGLAVQGPPLGNMYQVIIVLSLCFLPLFLVLVKRTGLVWAAPYFTMMAALPLIGGFFMKKDALWRRMPALQSHWFIPHVLAYMTAYALATAAFVFLAVKWIKRRRGTDDGRHDAAAYETLRLAFPFMTFGMLSGALWAEQAWGQYWSWDPKETWSLIMWMFYAVYLHARKQPELRKYADVAHLLGYLALLITFLLVNLLPRLASLLHGYA
jgi:ABC-type transport system involved in cytochrome c biogenesis permease subunit